MTPKTIRAEAETLFAAFQKAGAVPVEADILLPAGALLDLYGEDIRARAYVTQDPLLGEMMLRPDFTLPVVQAHMAHGADPARYCYLGEVFRKQDHPGLRAREYLQVGFEVFDRTAPEAADAEVFALFSQLLGPLNLTPATGDIGILLAAIKGLDTTDRRKAALLRHVWRPKRFRDLLARFSGLSPQHTARQDLLDRLSRTTPEALLAAAGPLIGLRTEAEITARTHALIEDARAAPISKEAGNVLARLLALEAPAARALQDLRDVSQAMPAISQAVDRFEKRLEALTLLGIDVTDLPFAASHGQSSLEYYDGFVFSFHGPDQTLPPVASGGRYDALTSVLGQGRSIPAVGGVIRPAMVAALKGGAT